MAKLGDLIVRVGADVSTLNNDLKQAKSSMKKMTGELQNVGKQMSMAVTAPLLIMGATSVQAFREQNKAIAQVEAGLKSTAGQVGFTSKELQKMATDLQNKTLFGDEVILKDATAQLLTFTNISGENFARTQQAALDLATRLDGDLKGASIQLGKALNDPVANLSALSRSGIQFSDEQKDVIKTLAETGRLAEAQTLILDELNKQYGGSAEAAAEADGGFTQLANSFGDLQEEIGALLVDFLKPIIAAFREFITFLQNTSTQTKKFALVFAGIAAAIGPLLVIIPSIISGFGMVASILSGPVVIAIGAVIGAVILIMEHWDEIVEYFTNGDGAKILEQIQTDMQDLGANLVMIWEMATGLIKAYWQMMGDDMIESTARSSGSISDITNGMFEFVGNIMGFFTAMMEGDWNNMWKRLANATLGYVQTIIEYVNGLIETTLSTMDSALSLVGADVDSAGTFRQIADEAMKLMDSMKFSFEETESAVDEFSNGLDGSSNAMEIAKGKGAQFIQSLNSVKSSTDKATKSTKDHKDSIEQYGTTLEDVLKNDTIETFSDRLENIELPELEEFDIVDEIFGDEDEWATAGDAIIETLDKIGEKAQSVIQSATNVGNTLGSTFADLKNKSVEIKLALQEGLISPLEAMEQKSEASKEAVRGLVKDGILALINFAKMNIIANATSPANAANLASGGLATPAFIVAGLSMLEGFIGGLTAFADGGIVSGPTMGLIGEYPGARNNPEVIAPLDKLRGMLGGQSVQVTGRLSGRDILLSSEYSNIDRNRIRGY